MIWQTAAPDEEQKPYAQNIDLSIQPYCFIKAQNLPMITQS